jgi:hypothetical protein
MTDSAILETLVTNPINDRYQNGCQNYTAVLRDCAGKTLAVAEKAETVAFEQPTAVQESKHANVKKAYGQLPLYFEANQ